MLVRNHEFVRLARDMLALLRNDAVPEKETAIAAVLLLLCQHTAAQSEQLWQEYPGWTPEQIVYRMRSFV